MHIKLILPRSVYKKNILEMTINGATLHALLNSIKENHPKLGGEILDIDDEFKKNVILVLNDTIIPKEKYPTLAFAENSILEIMFQFAGG